MTASIYTLATPRLGISTAAATTALWTVAGGRVLILGLYGVVATAPGAGAALATLIANPTTGTDSPLSIASASLALAPIGTLISITGNVAQAPAISANQGALAGMTTPLIVQPGTIDLLIAVGDATGVIDWYVDWRALDQGARIT